MTDSLSSIGRRPAFGGKRLCRLLSLLVVVALFLLSATLLSAQQPAAAMPAKPLRFEDQFERKTDVADLRGSVVVLVYGDRKGSDICRSFGERLHLAFHPTAKGLPPAKAQQAPVIPLPGLRPGQCGPDVCVVPVACCGAAPGPVKSLIRFQMAKGSPDVVVWLDFLNTMKDSFGLKSGEVNLVVLDAAGRPRHKLNGNPDKEVFAKLLRAVQELRIEAASGK